MIAMTDLSDRQAAASRQGKAFEDTVELLLLVEGWTINDRHWRHPEVDVEIDIVATDPTGQTWWIECKGSWESTRNGLARTDTLKKAIFNGAMLRLCDDRERYMVVTSRLPSSGAGQTWIHRAIDLYVDEIRVVGFTERPGR